MKTKHLNHIVVACVSTNFVDADTVTKIRSSIRICFSFKCFFLLRHLFIISITVVSYDSLFNSTQRHINKFLISFIFFFSFLVSVSISLALTLLVLSFIRSFALSLHFNFFLIHAFWTDGVCRHTQVKIALMRFHTVQRCRQSWYLRISFCHFSKCNRQVKETEQRKPKWKKRNGMRIMTKMWEKMLFLFIFFFFSKE